MNMFLVGWLCLTDHEQQDWQPCPIDPFSAENADYTCSRLRFLSIYDFTSSTEVYTLLIHVLLLYAMETIIKSSGQEWNSRIHTINNSETVRLLSNRATRTCTTTRIATDHVEQIVH